MDFDSDLIIIFGGVVAIIFIVNYFGYLNRRKKQQLIEKLIEKGQPLSSDLLDTITGTKPQAGGVGSAVSLILVGIALGTFLWAMTGYGVPSFLPFVGLFPIAIGLSRLIGLAFDKPKDRQ